MHHRASSIRIERFACFFVFNLCFNIYGVINICLLFSWAVLVVESPIATDALQYSEGGEVRGGSTDFKAHSKILHLDIWGNPKHLRGHFPPPYRKVSSERPRECVSQKGFILKIKPHRPLNREAAGLHPTQHPKKSCQVRHYLLIIISSIIFLFLFFYLFIYLTIISSCTSCS